MNDPEKTPRRLLELLANEEHGKALRGRLKHELKDVLKEYHVDKDVEVPKDYEPPSAERVQLALSMIEEPAAATDEHWKTYAQLVVVIGAIPFVADDAR